jgi:hypothetical protein
MAGLGYVLVVEEYKALGLILGTAKEEKEKKNWPALSITHFVTNFWGYVFFKATFV